MNFQYIQKFFFVFCLSVIFFQDDLSARGRGGGHHGGSGHGGAYYHGRGHFGGHGGWRGRGHWNGGDWGGYGFGPGFGLGAIAYPYGYTGYYGYPGPTRCDSFYDPTCDGYVLPVSTYYGSSLYYR